MEDITFTRIPNKYIKYIKDKDYEVLSSNDLLIFILLMQNINSKGVTIFNIKWLCDKLGTTIKNRKRIKSLEKTLNALDFKYYDSNSLKIKTNPIKIIENDKNTLIFAKSNIEIDDNFTKIEDWEVDEILEYCNNNTIDKALIVHLYTYIVSCINNNESDEEYGLAYPKIETIEQELEISRNTILKYMNILDELKIITSNYVGYKITNGKIKMTNTYYCRYRDKELLDKYINKLKKDKGNNSIDNEKKNKINLKRSLKQKINKLNQKENKTEEENNKLEKLLIEYESLN